MTVVPDRTFGNCGTLWSGMAIRYVGGYPADESVRTVGGYATGLHLLPTGAASLVVGGWTHASAPASPSVADESPRFSTVRLIVFPPDGAPRERLLSDGTLVHDVSEARRMALPVASCTTSSGNVAVLVRQVPFPQNAFLPWEFVLYEIAPTGERLSSRPVLPAWLHGELPASGPASVRLAVAGTGLGIVSSVGSRVRVTVLGPAGAVPRDVDLAGSPALPGLTRLEVASARFDGGSASVALTAFLDHPGVGATSVGAVLQVRADGTRDSGFGENGLWVSPLSVGYRGFVAAGETAGLLAGAVGRRAVVFGLDPGGTGLDQSFGDSGVAEHDLGGPLSDVVTASDAGAVYVFAQRVPTQADPGGDLRAAGCRFHRAPGAAVHGAPDGGWGTAGTVTLRCDGAAVTPAGMVVSGSQLFVGGTRQLRGADFDRLPVVVDLATADGDPAVTFGTGAFALFGSVNRPAIVMPDGAAVFVERVAGVTSPVLRFVTPTGEEGRREALTPVPAGSTVNTLTRLADGGLLVAGGGAEAWVAKVGTKGALDTSFGTGGMVKPKPGSGQGDARGLGLRANGDIALQIDSGLTTELAVMHPSGRVDAGYGTGGFADVKGFTHPGGSGDLRCFLDADGSVICVASSIHAPASSLSTPVRVGLRRVTPDGAYDPNFGLGLPSLQTPTTASLHELLHPLGASPGYEEYSRIAPVGTAWLGDRLYVVATGWSGGAWLPVANSYRPSYPVLLVLAWNADGTADPTFATSGRQEGGYLPKTAFWGAAGVLSESPTSFLVYGTAGELDPVTTSVGGVTTTDLRRRQPQPALWRVAHPGGLDSSFGGDGMSTIRLQEFFLSAVAGGLLSGGRVRVACVDLLRQPWTDEPRVNVGGLAQWRPARLRPGRPL